MKFSLTAYYKIREIILILHELTEDNSTDIQNNAPIQNYMFYLMHVLYL